MYDFFPYPRYKETIEKIENEYDGCVEKWLEYCASVRDNAINGVMETDEYKKFNSMDLSQYNFAPICGERSCYTEETNGKRFLSIDLRKANFQALKYAGVVSDATYEQFIHRFGGDDYIANSKYLRQVIFGKMNPSRQIKIEKYLMSKVYEVIKDVTEKYRFTIFSMNSDELIFAITEEFYNNRQEDENTRELINDIYNLVGKNIGVEIKVEYIEVRRLPIVSANGTKIDAYERTNLFTSQKTLKKASTNFYPQIVDEVTFSKAQDIRQENAITQNRIRPVVEEEPPVVPDEFHVGKIEKRYDDPYMQAEYAYSQIGVD